MVQLFIDYGLDCHVRTHGHSNQATRDLLISTQNKINELFAAARDGNESEVWRLVVNGHTNMVFNNVHAADVAEEAGHSALARQLRERWGSVSRAPGYLRWNSYLQRSRARWLVLRKRFTTQNAGQSLAHGVVDDRTYAALQWLLVQTVGGCPARPMRMVMEYWCD